MKKLKLYSQNLKDVQILSREELKMIVGKGPGSGNGGTFCASDGFVCYEQNGVKYTCSQQPWGTCCCGHYLGDDNCEA